MKPGYLIGACLLGGVVGYVVGRSSLRHKNRVHNECAVQELEAIARGHISSFDFAALPEMLAAQGAHESELMLKEWIARVNTLTERGKANIAQLVESNRLRVEAAKILVEVGDK